MNKPKLSISSDIDWQYQEFSFAKLTIKSKKPISDEEATNLLIEQDRKIACRFVSEFMYILPTLCNGIKFGINNDFEFLCEGKKLKEKRNLERVTKACLEVLKRKPGTRIFEISGKFDPC